MSKNIQILAVCALAAGLSACGKDSSPTAPSPNCSQVTLTPASQSFPGGGGAGTIAVTIPAGCAWTAAPSAAWMAITSGASGSGPGSVAFTVSGNLSLSSRSGAVAVSGVQAAVTQSGTPNDPSCQFVLSPPSRAMTAQGGGFLVQVFALAGCRWEFASGPAWLQVIAEGEGAPNGNGNGSVEAHIAANPDAGPRTGQALIAGKWLTVTQDGQSASACSYTIAPASHSASAAGGAGSVSINTAPGCSWRIEAEQGSVAWISINSGQRGSGPETIPYFIQPNQTFSSRTANVVVRGDSGNARLVQTVTQAGAGCLYTISPTQATHDWTGNYDSGRTPFTAQVTTQPADCVWTATTSAPSWIVVSGSQRQGRGTVSYSLWTNNTGYDRTGQILVQGLSGLNPPARLTVTQTAR